MQSFSCFIWLAKSVFWLWFFYWWLPRRLTPKRKIGTALGFAGRVVIYVAVAVHVLAILRMLELTSLLASLVVALAGTGRVRAWAAESWLKAHHLVFDILDGRLSPMAPLFGMARMTLRNIVSAGHTTIGTIVRHPGAFAVAGGLMLWELASACRYSSMASCVGASDLSLFTHLVENSPLRVSYPITAHALLYPLYALVRIDPAKTLLLAGIILASGSILAVYAVVWIRTNSRLAAVVAATCLLGLLSWTKAEPTSFHPLALGGLLLIFLWHPEADRDPKIRLWTGILAALVHPMVLFVWIVFATSRIIASEWPPKTVGLQLVALAATVQVLVLAAGRLLANRSIERLVQETWVGAKGGTLVSWTQVFAGLAVILLSQTRSNLGRATGVLMALLPLAVAPIAAHFPLSSEAMLMVLPPTLAVVAGEATALGIGGIPKALSRHFRPLEQEG